MGRLISSLQIRNRKQWILSPVARLSRDMDDAPGQARSHGGGGRGY